jgi:hypothetical protein
VLPRPPREQRSRAALRPVIFQNHSPSEALGHRQ